jgi:protein-tyrosine-phosphatase
MFGKKEKKVRVLFVDEKNDLTSQLAEYFTKEYFENKYEVYSAGPQHDLVDCELISVMYQRGEDMRRQVSKDFKDRDHLREDEDYDIVVFLRKNVFDEWSKRTPWQGKQILYEMGSTKDFTATDDFELGECYSQLIDRVSAWVKENMEDPKKLRSLISA